MAITHSIFDKITYFCKYSPDGNCLLSREQIVVDGRLNATGVTCSHIGGHRLRFYFYSYLRWVTILRTYNVDIRNRKYLMALV